MKLNIVPARTGFLWVKLGVQTFFRQPLALTGLFFLYMAAATLLSLVPFVGVVLALAIVPAATLGLMVATQDATKGKFPMPAVLVSAFRADTKRLRAMVVLGLLYAVTCVAVMSLASLIVEVPREASGPAAGMMSPQYQLAMAVGMVMYLPISLMFWHAPALVHWHGVSPFKSLFFSTVACIRNGKALLLFGVAWLGLIVGASLLVGAVTALTGSVQFATAALMPLGLLITAMFSTSIYFTFRDSFVAEPEPGDALRAGEQG